MSQPDARRKPKPPAPPPTMSGTSAVTMGNTSISLAATTMPGGTKAHVDCNGQQLDLFFDGQTIEVDIVEPAGP